MDLYVESGATLSEDQSLIKYRSDQIKKTKGADSWIPRKLRVFVLLAHTFRSFGFTYYENTNNTFVEVQWTDLFLRVFFQIITEPIKRILNSHNVTVNGLWIVTSSVTFIKSANQSKLATVKGKKADVSSVSPSSERFIKLLLLLLFIKHQTMSDCPPGCRVNFYIFY